MNPIRDMRERLAENLRGTAKPFKGYDVGSFAPTRNNEPRMPQSTIPSPKASYDSVGRPPKESKELPMYRKKPRDIWGGWL